MGKDEKGWDMSKIAGEINAEMMKACAATNPQELERQIMSSLVPKNEREHWAAREITHLRNGLENERATADAFQKVIRQADEDIKDLRQQLADTIERQAAQIELLRDFIKTAPVASGVCCCGESMEGHSSPMSCGHSPVDMWDYSAADTLSINPDQALEQLIAKVKERCAQVCEAGTASDDWFGDQYAKAIRNLEIKL